MVSIALPQAVQVATKCGGTGTAADGDSSVRAVPSGAALIRKRPGSCVETFRHAPWLHSSTTHDWPVELAKLCAKRCAFAMVRLVSVCPLLTIRNLAVVDMGD